MSHQKQTPPAANRGRQNQNYNNPIVPHSLRPVNRRAFASFEEAWSQAVLEWDRMHRRMGAA